jgi:drug/metabolite transporter (DMT)-like permease
MFFFLTLIAVVGFSLQSTLMVSYYRRIDPLFGITLRSLGVTAALIPLLFFVPKSSVQGLVPHLPYLISAGGALVFANWARGAAYRMLPVGIVVAFCQSLTAIVLLVVSASLLGDIISDAELRWIGGLILGISLLGFVQSHGTSPVALQPIRGIILSVVHSVLIACALIAVGKAARDSHPIIVSFTWELSAGVFGILLTFLKGKCHWQIFSQISRKDLPQVLLYCAPAAVGLACYTYSFSLGPVAIASCILTAAMTLSAIFAYFLYGERLTRPQIVLVLFIWAQIVGLKLAGSY